MNRSSKGFGLISVLCVVIVMIVTAVFSASANSKPASDYLSNQQAIK